MFLFVVNRRDDWQYEIPGIRAVTARAYLTDPVHGSGLEGRVVNLCRCDRYQGRGYYVSLLAEARGHRPLPDVKAVEDFQSAPLARALAEQIEAALADTLASDAPDEMSIDSYFGRDPTGRYPAVSQQLFALAKVPLVRVSLRRAGGRWTLTALQALSAADVPPPHRAALQQAATEFATGTAAPRVMTMRDPQPALAILWNHDEPEPSSDAEAIERFRRAAAAIGMRTEILDRRAIDRLAEFDGLFIRDTTHIGHYTYEFSRRAAAEGLVVIDEPDSILQCNNKVYLNELMARHRVPVPKTVMVHRDNIGEVVATLGLPCILKQPDSSFSLGVGKVETEAQLVAHVEKLLDHSELIVAQEYLPTEFDWRVGILDRRPLYVCKYHMAPGHWQIIKREAARKLEGVTTALSVGEAPSLVVKTALRAANLIGDGLYGVDLKYSNDRCYLIEVNDNPTIDADKEDAILQDALYREIMGVFYRRIKERRWKAAA